jgi:leader peptidase (prepilin peptidase) / N-methyltransferase
MRRTTVICASTGAVALLVAGSRLTHAPLTMARLLVLGGAFGVLVPYDIREHRIPNRIVLPAAAVCAVLSLAEGVHANTQLLVGAGLVLGLLCVSLAAPAVLGMGDVKLALLIVCALDAFAVLALALTFEVYVMVALVLLFERGRAALKMSLPLAPITAAGCLIALLL